MIPTRRTLLKREPTAPPATPDYEIVNVTRLEVVLDTGHPLSFDLEADDDYREGERFLVVTIGKRVIKLATPRILYTEVRPAQVRRPRQKPALTPDQIAALQ